MITRRFFGRLALATMFSLAFACSQKAPEQPAAPGGSDAGAGGATSGDKVIKLAAVLPLTGPNASLGQEASNAAKLAVKQWNDGKKIPGYTIEFVAEDDASDAKQAVSAANRVAGDPAVLGVVAHFNSGCLLPASQIYHRAGLMAISPAATNPQVTLQGFKEIARVCSHDNVQGMAAAEFLVKRGWKKVAVIHDKTQYGMGLAEVMRKEGEARGLTIQSFDGINVGDKDFKGLLTKVKAQGPDVIYFGGLHEEAAFLVRQMKDLGLTAQFVSDDGVFGQDFLNNGGPAAEGAIVSFPSTPLDKLPAAGEFFKAFEAEFKAPVLNWGPYGYDAANILLDSMKKAVEEQGSQEPLRARVVKYATTGNHQGLLGDLKFDQNGDPVNQRFSFYQVKNGKLEYLETIERKATP